MPKKRQSSGTHPCYTPSVQLEPKLIGASTPLFPQRFVLIRIPATESLARWATRSCKARNILIFAAPTTMVHVRVDENTKQQAAKTLASMGISSPQPSRVKANASRTPTPCLRTSVFDFVRGPVEGAQLRRDINLAQKRGKDMAKLKALILLLVDGGILPPRYKDHPLSGDLEALPGLPC